MMNKKSSRKFGTAAAVTAGARRDASSGAAGRLRLLTANDGKLRQITVKNFPAIPASYQFPDFPNSPISRMNVNRTLPPAHPNRRNARQGSPPGGLVLEAGSFPVICHAGRSRPARPSRNAHVLPRNGKQTRAICIRFTVQSVAQN